MRLHVNNVSDSLCWTDLTGYFLRSPVFLLRSVQLYTRLEYNDGRIKIQRLLRLTTTTTREKYDEDEMKIQYTLALHRPTHPHILTEEFPI